MEKKIIHHGEHILGEIAYLPFLWLAGATPSGRFPKILEDKCTISTSVMF